MDWIRLGNSGKDLTGVGGIPRDVPGSELAKHNRREDAWLAIKGESRFSCVKRAPLMMCDRFANIRTQPQRLVQILNHEAPACLSALFFPRFLRRPWSLVDSCDARAINCRFVFALFSSFLQSISAGSVV
jgi:hypothetical protein